MEEIECVCGAIRNNWQDYINCLLFHEEINEEVGNDKMG